MRLLFYVFSCLLGVFGMVSCQEEVPLPPPEPVEEEIEVLDVDTLTAMESIEARGTLIALTTQPELNYHLNNGRPAGFQFELLDDFSEFLGTNLELRICDSLSESLQALHDRSVDIYTGAVDTSAIDTTCHYIFLKLPGATVQTFAWVFPKRENDTSLTTAINLWMQDYQVSDMNKSYLRYFNNKGEGRQAEPTSRLSEYDPLIKAQAKKMGWDWRLLASIIYQESHFKPDLVSEKGAFGLMQLMPVTMENYGIDYDSSVEEQLAAAGKLLMHFSNELPESINDSIERSYFILASYNAGMGHVKEARLKAERKGKNPDVWTDNVEQFTPRQTYFFVKEVTKRFSHYKALIE